MTGLSSPPGTQDVLPPASGRWQELVARFATRVGRAGYRLVLGPMFEEAAVFQRVGTETEIVRKEMYTFTDRGGRELALRPESTASVVRSYLQHRPALPFKAWYAAPHFRYERAQAGRYRQHHSLGAEALGTPDPALDVELVELAWCFVTEDLGITGVELVVNSLGDGNCRPAYVAELAAYLHQRLGELCDEHAARLGTNPLRVLDCKRESCRAATRAAPRLLDSLCGECRQHFDAVRAGLASAGIDHRVEPRLVRGLDYYTRTLFELPGTALAGAQNALGGGGRYDALAQALGGPEVPGMGFGLGMERLLLAADAEGLLAPDGSAVAVWVVDLTGGEQATEICRALRRTGVSCDRSYDSRSLKAQMKAADRSGARFALLVGEQEQAQGVVTVRDLTTGEQAVVARAGVVGEVRALLDGSVPSPADEGGTRQPSEGSR